MVTTLSTKSDSELIEKLYGQIDALLAHCPDSECDVCASIICPHKDPMHFHHDGCPSCEDPSKGELLGVWRLLC